MFLGSIGTPESALAEFDDTDLLKEFRDVFPAEFPHLPPIREIEHVIDTGLAKPIHKPPYRMSPRDLDVLREQLESLTRKGLIQPSTSPWSAPVLFVKRRTAASYVRRLPSTECSHLETEVRTPTTR